MAPIGELLRSAREQKSLSLDRVAEETNIAKRYLAALEAEDFTVFPGDPYVIGFLRNYAEYLGLSSDELVASYKSLKIQEQSIPVNALLPQRGISRSTSAAVAGALVVVLIIAAVLLGGRRAHGGVQQIALQHTAPTQYQMDGPSFEKRLYVGDSVLVSLNGQKYKISVSSIDDAVNLDTPAGPTRLMLGEEGTIDLDRNNQPEIKVLVSDLAKKDPSKGATLRFAFINPDAAINAATQAPPSLQQAEAANAANPDIAQNSPPPPAEPIPAGAKTVALFEAARSPYPFVVSVTFRGPCLFRYEIDRKNRNEHYYGKGETLTINANNSVKVWTSDAQAAKLTVSASGGKSADLDLGGPGEVAVKKIAWSQADSGGWTLSAYDID
jgi:cytoskeletal protein RodZ